MGPQVHQEEDWLEIFFIMIMIMITIIIIIIILIIIIMLLVIVIVIIVIMILITIITGFQSGDSVSIPLMIDVFCFCTPSTWSCNSSDGV